MKLVVFQRVLPKYRYDLLKELSTHPLVSHVHIIASQGEAEGAQKSYHPVENDASFTVSYVPSLKFHFQGKFRSTFIPFYPWAYRFLYHGEIVLLEGTTNIFNNIFLVPMAKLFRKKIIWWDAGYSEPVRSRSRKIKDAVLRWFILMSDAQMVYSQQAKTYLETYMGAHRCFINVNTIGTRYFESRYPLIEMSTASKIASFERGELNLLYVGAVEKRKGLKEFLDELETRTFQQKVTMRIIGGGSYKDELQTFSWKNIDVIFDNPIYDMTLMEPYYLDAHFFILPGEGGLAIIQAMQFGVPVLTCKADGTEEEYIDHQRNGFIMPNIAAIAGLLETPPLNESLYKEVHTKSKTIGSKYWAETFVHQLRELNQK